MTDAGIPTPGASIGGDGLTAEALRALVESRHGDPFAILGPHDVGGRRIVRVWMPGAAEVQARPSGDAGAQPVTLHPHPQAPGLFEAEIAHTGRYELLLRWPDGSEQRTADPYAFGPILGDLDLHLIAEGRHLRLGDALGSHVARIDGVDGVRFAVWAPNAARVAVVGDFNGWDGRRHGMRLRPDAGIWEIFIPGVGPGARYKYQLLAADGTLLPLKADPVARASEAPPLTASVVPAADVFSWSDDDWMAERAQRDPFASPMSIYEVHAASWMHGDDGGALDWDALAPPHAWRFERNGRSQLLRPGRLRMVANNAEALLAGALAGLGIAHLPTWLISEYLLRGELLPLFCEGGLPQPEASGIYALRLTREADSRTRLLLEFLKSRFGPVPPWDQALNSGLKRE